MADTGSEAKSLSLCELNSEASEEKQSLQNSLSNNNCEDCQALQ